MLPHLARRSHSELKGRQITHILNTLNQHMQLYGYNLIELPIIDSADIFLVKAGDEIINNLFTFDRRGKQFALRPEFTASAADYFAHSEGDAVARWQFSGSIFEDKSHESNPGYEQLGIGAELIGLSGSLADAEIIAMSATGLRKLGIVDAAITIGHVGLLRESISQFNLDARTQRFLLHHIPALSDPKKGKKWIFDQFIAQLSSVKTIISSTIDTNVGEPNSSASLTMGGRTQEDIMRRLVLKRQRLDERDNVYAALNSLDDWCQISDTPQKTFTYLSALVSEDSDAARLLKEWRETIVLLETHEIPIPQITIKPNLARSWDYYTGIVFELHSNGTHLGGGGRYDDLAQLIGSQTGTPAVGYTYYGDRLVNALAHTSLPFTPPISIIARHDDMQSAAKWATQIRSLGLSVQILPQSMQSSTNPHQVYLENASTASFQTTKYNFQQIDRLISDLKQIEQ